jgi:hypothetical protein
VKPIGIKADGLGAMGMDPVSDPILDLVSGLDMDQELDLELGVDMESGLDLDLGMDLEAGLSLDPVFELDPDLNMDLDTDINTVLVLLVFSLMSSASLPLESLSVALIPFVGGLFEVPKEDIILLPVAPSTGTNVGFGLSVPDSELLVDPVEFDVLFGASRSSVMVLVPDLELPVVFVGSNNVNSTTESEQVHLAETFVTSHSFSLLPVAGALALGDRLHSISGSSGNGNPIVLNKQMLSYYRRAKTERGSRVNDSLLLEAVESLSAPLVQYHLVAGFVGFHNSQVKPVPKNTNPMRGILRRGFLNPSSMEKGPRTKGTFDIVENGLTKPQKWLIEWMRAGVKDDDQHMASLKDMEEDFRWANMVACNGKLFPDPLDQGLDGDEEEDRKLVYQKLALLNKVKENFLWEIKVVQPRTKVKFRKLY